MPSIEYIAATANQPTITGDVHTLEGLQAIADKNPSFRMEGNSLIQKVQVDEECLQRIEDRLEWKVNMEDYFKNLSGENV